MDEKGKINILMNIKNYYGTSNGRILPWLLFFGISAVPVVIYVFLLMPFIPFKYMLIFELLFAGETALITVGQQKKRREAYKKMLEGQYDTISSLVRVTKIRHDGLVEMLDGSVLYLITGTTSTYYDDDKFAEDMEAFIHRLKDYRVDMCLHLVYDEDRLQDKTRWMEVYTEPAMVKERMEFYMEQDKYSNENTMLYRYVFVVHGYKYRWKEMRAVLEATVKSYESKVFKECHVCDRREVENIMSRDIGAYATISDMLRERYHNEEYFGSRVLFYGDEIPEDLRPKKEDVGFEHMRVVEEVSQQNVQER